jgi:hypothetical protein
MAFRLWLLLRGPRDNGGSQYSLKSSCRTKNASSITFPSSCDSLEWDQRSSTFTGIVPVDWCAPYSQRSRGFKITITAAIVQQVDKMVCFKQTIRTSVNIPMHATREAQLCSGLRDHQYGRFGRKFETVHVVEGRCRPIKRRKRLPSLRVAPTVSISAPEEEPG